MSDLTILTVVENDKGTLDLMIRSVYKFTKDVPKIIICDQGNNGDLKGKYANDPNITIVQNIPTMKGGSNRHGEGLNKIFSLVTTSKTAIIESDCILLTHDWEMYLTKHHKMVAAPKGKDIYHICFVLFNTDALKGIDFRPGTDKNRANRSYKPKEDVGWQMSKFVDKKDIAIMNFVDCKTGSGAYFNKSFQSDELWFGIRPVVAHFGRGSNISGKAVRKGFNHPLHQLKDWKDKAEEILK